MTENQRKSKIPNKQSLRNMKQFKDMSDDEFNEYYEKVVLGIDKDEIVQARYDKLLKQFEDEYDLSEMLPNDRAVLNSLISAILQLDDYRAMIREVTKQGILTPDKIGIMRELNTACTNLTREISSMQDDLKITRKSRKADKEESVINYLEDLKIKARTFARQKMQYIFCENCGQLLATVWWQVPEQKNNAIFVECKRKLPDETPCGWSKKIYAKDLLESGGSNKIENMPESMR